jgi:2-methylcitrate dehydratase PrpD
VLQVAWTGSDIATLDPHRTYFKPYSCCRWPHAPVDALLARISEHDIKPDDIVRIDTDTFGRTLTLGNEIAPATFESRQYSLPFCLGVAATRCSAAIRALRGGATSPPCG